MHDARQSPTYEFSNIHQSKRKSRNLFQTALDKLAGKNEEYEVTIVYQYQQVKQENHENECNLTNTSSTGNEVIHEFKNIQKGLDADPPKAPPKEEKVGHKVKILVKVLSCLISPKAHHVLLEVVLAAISPIK